MCPLQCDVGVLVAGGNNPTRKMLESRQSEQDVK